MRCFVCTRVGQHAHKRRARAYNDPHSSSRHTTCAISSGLDCSTSYASQCGDYSCRQSCSPAMTHEFSSPLKISGSSGKTARNSNTNQVPAVQEMARSGVILLTAALLAYCTSPVDSVGAVERPFAFHAFSALPRTGLSLRDSAQATTCSRNICGGPALRRLGAGGDQPCLRKSICLMPVYVRRGTDTKLRGATGM